MRSTQRQLSVWLVSFMTSDHITTQGFKNEGDVIILLGETKAELGGSEFQYVIHGVTEGRPPRTGSCNGESVAEHACWKRFKKVLLLLRMTCPKAAWLLRWRKSVSAASVGATVNVATELRADLALFSESQSRILLSATPEKADELEAFVREQGVPVCK